MKLFITIFFTITLMESAKSETDRPTGPADVECKVEYTVTEQGTTKDIVLLGCGTEEETKWFGPEAIKAAKNYRYKPKIVDGVSVEVPNVVIPINFWLNQTNEN